MRLSFPHGRTIALRLALASGALLFACGAITLAAGAFFPARAEDRSPALPGKLDALDKTLVIDGSRVQYAGNLQMNVTNFGFLGSMPASRMSMSDSPSAQWPAGSGIEYLYAAGIWIGAERTGVPSVSTGYPETELYPSDDPIDVIYRSSEGRRGAEITRAALRARNSVSAVDGTVIAFWTTKYADVVFGEWEIRTDR